ncbi:MAG: site-specific DNA-methyltransferase [Mycoplasma sp.]|nr:site-specific DNA-methyltransferase [Mycoplasma sp.]
MKSYLNKVFYKSSKKMTEIPTESVDLIVTSPPYFNIKDYSKDGKQINKHSQQKNDDVGNISNFKKYLESLLSIWKECFRILKSNGKLCINVPLLPIKKSMNSSTHNRIIYDLQSQIQNSILNNTKFSLMDLYIWNRTNSSKKLMFGSYPYPRNFYAQNTTEFVTVYVKDGKPINNIPKKFKEQSKLSVKEWTNLTKQIWNIPAPNRGDAAFGEHSAIMPIELANRCIRLFSFVGDIVADPFAGSGTTLLAAKKLKRNFVGYEIYKNYKKTIDKKVYGKK